MKPLLIFIFGKILLKVKNKIVLSVMFSAAAAILSAFLDALTVMAVLITVFVALYGVYEKVHSMSGAAKNDEDDSLVDMGGDTLSGFRAFIRSLVMHGAIGTALGGVMTQVGEPQNLLISEKNGLEFCPVCPGNVSCHHSGIYCRHVYGGCVGAVWPEIRLRYQIR
jgi:NhaB family Na+:H+ antiporter